MNVIVHSNLEQLFDSWSMCTPSMYQHAVPTYHLEFHLLYIIYTEVFSAVHQHAGD